MRILSKICSKCGKVTINSDNKATFNGFMLQVKQLPALNRNYNELRDETVHVITDSVNGYWEVADSTSQTLDCFSGSNVNK